MRRNEEDLLNPDRTFYKLFRDYREGHLTKPWLKLYRARVIQVSTERGDLEENPPNPPNSVKARIYTAGMDANIPNSALSVFHPMFPSHLAPPISVGEHVYVVFEDEQMSHGLWISPVSSHVDLNNSDPDTRSTEARRDASTPFGDNNSSGQSGNRNRREEYEIPSDSQSGRQEIVDQFENTLAEDRWAGKNVLLIGDSMVGDYGLRDPSPRSPLSLSLRGKLRNKNVSSFRHAGRRGWTMHQWSTGRGGNAGGQIEIPAKTISQLVRQFSIDILLITLGGNDATGGASYDQARRRAERVWEEVTSLGLDFAIWCGPPSIIRGTSRVNSTEESLRRFTENMNNVNNAIKSVVRDRYFIDCRSLTSQPDLSTNRRARDGLHWAATAPIGDPWAQLFLDKASQL